MSVPLAQPIVESAAGSANYPLKRTHLKNNSSYRAVVDYDVDRTGVEAW